MLWWTLRQFRSKSPHVRRQAAAKLGASKEVRAIKPLIVALKDQDQRVRATAANVLGEIGDVRAVEPLVAALQDNNFAVQGAAMKALKQIGPAAVGGLVEILHDPDAGMRQAAAGALGRIGHRQAVGPLIKTLADSEKTVRRIAA